MDAVGLSNLGYSGHSDMRKVWWEMSELGEFCLGHVKFEMSIRHPSEDNKLGDGYVSSEQDNLGLKMKNQPTGHLQHIDDI